MNREKLAQMGLEEERIGQILELQKEDEAERERMRSELEERQKQLETLKGFEGDNAALKERLAQLEQENAERAAQYEKDLKAQGVQAAVRMELLNWGHRPHNVDLVMGLLKLDGLELDKQGRLKGGIEKQIEAVEAANPFLFNHEAAGQPAGSKPKAPNPATQAPAKKEVSAGRERALQAIKARQRATGAKGGTP